jgi:hypothetical protein
MRKLCSDPMDMKEAGKMFKAFQAEITQTNQVP